MPGSCLSTVANYITYHSNNKQTMDFPWSFFIMIEMVEHMHSKTDETLRNGGKKRWHSEHPLCLFPVFVFLCKSFCCMVSSHSTVCHSKQLVLVCLPHFWSVRGSHWWQSRDLDRWLPYLISMKITLAHGGVHTTVGPNRAPCCALNSNMCPVEQGAS